MPHRLHRLISSQRYIQIHILPVIVFVHTLLIGVTHDQSILVRPYHQLRFVQLDEVFDWLSEMVVICCFYIDSFGLGEWFLQC